MEFCFGSYGACFDLKFFLPTSKTMNLMGEMAGAVGMMWFERLKKKIGLIFSPTSEDHNFCSGYQNHYYFICIWGGI